MVGVWGVMVVVVVAVMVVVMVVAVVVVVAGQALAPGEFAASFHEAAPLRCSARDWLATRPAKT